MGRRTRSTDRDALTALPEYRNGGLLIDTGVLRSSTMPTARRVWDVGSEIVVEWRALTVACSTTRAEGARASSAAANCRSRACSKAARGPRDASSPSSCAAAIRRSPIARDGTVF